FAQATTSIQYVENMLAEISKQHDEQIGQLHHQASLTSALQLTAMLILGLLFGGALYLLNNFVLKPIGKLAQASNNIALGQLDIPMAKMANNELGELGQSFERMRLQLKNDLAMRLQNELELKKLNTAIDQSMAAVQITNAQGIVEYSNNQFEKVTGYSSQELVGKKAGIWRSGETKDSTYADLWSTIQRGQVWVGELLNKRKNGEYYWALVSISPVIVEQKITHFIDIHLDISEHKRVAERLDFISYYDQTTNLPNRQLLARHYEQVQKNYVKLAIVSISLGRLKQINDSFGWAVGDQVLRIIGQRLKSVVSKNDIVSHLEGGHFALMLCQPHDNNALHIYVQQVIDELNKPINIEKYSLQLIPNAGICVSQSRSFKFEQVLKNANIALHRAEQSADSSVCIFSNEINLDVQQRVVLEHALRQAIENNQLELHYQPKVEIETGKILSVEALARWFHPDSNKMISPVVFVRLAEENGLINALGDWVLRQACRQLKAWQQQGLNELTMAVNISFEQLRQAGFVHRVEQIINEENVDPQYLEFELTESIFMENPEQAMIIFAELKNMGIKLAIDDFGTGYSSLAYLSRLPVDFLKIDRSFVEEMTVDHRAAAITTSIIALGHRMGLRVIAEGVETAAQLAYLAQHRCDQMQGFYFSRPVPAQGLLKLFEKETVS
ncbi:MAG: EAL domain-containing protein, partial [Venatoribacter sp.]